MRLAGAQKRDLRKGPRERGFCESTSCEAARENKITMVLANRLELLRLTALVPKTSVSTNSTTRARYEFISIFGRTLHALFGIPLAIL